MSVEVGFPCIEKLIYYVRDVLLGYIFYSRTALNPADIWYMRKYY
jgi:hypothetical protein